MLTDASETDVDTEDTEHVAGYTYDRDAWTAAIEDGVPYYWIVRPHYAQAGRYQIRKAEGPLGTPLGVPDCELDKAIRLVDALRAVHTRPKAGCQ